MLPLARKEIIMKLLTRSSNARSLRSILAWACVAVALLGVGAPGSRTDGRAAPSDRAPDGRQYTDQVRPFLAKHCLECHGAEKTKGKLRLAAWTLGW